MCHISCGEGETGQERVQSSEGYGGLVVMLSAVHAERGRWEIVSVQTLYLVLWFGAEEAKGSGESHCDMRVHRTKEFLNFLLLFRPLLLLVSSPLLFGSGTRS